MKATRWKIEGREGSFSKPLARAVIRVGGEAWSLVVCGMTKGRGLNLLRLQFVGYSLDAMMPGVLVDRVLIWAESLAPTTSIILHRSEVGYKEQRTDVSLLSSEVRLHCFDSPSCRIYHIVDQLPMAKPCVPFDP